MKNWSFHARADYMREGKSLDDLLMNKANIIDDNDIVLDAASYYNCDELEWGIRLFMNILF
jgi:hypothetical protein